MPDFKTDITQEGVLVSLAGHIHDDRYYTETELVTPGSATIDWANIINEPSTFAPSAHAASHMHGGADEVATATPGNNAIPKANGVGKLALGWLLTGSGNGLDADLLDAQHGAYYLARANHTGTQLAATISDFDAQVQTNRLDQMANPTASVSLNSQKIVNLLDPTSAQDAATKSYVDALLQALDIKASVRVATTGNITLSGTQTIDGIAVQVGDRVLVKDQSTGADNGIYVVAAGSWTRATDADVSADVTSGMYTFVAEGTVNGDNGWALTTNDPITLGTTALVFTQFSGAGQVIAGAGLSKNGNTLDVNVDTTTIEIAADILRRAALTGDVTSAAGSAATTIANNAVTDVKLRDSALLSVIGRSANSAGDPADIAAVAASGAVLRESGSTIGFGTVATAGIANDAVTFAKFQNISTDKLLGRDTAASGDVEEIGLGASLSFDGSNNIQRAALTGDVTAVVNSNATTIANDAVTNAKLNNMATQTIKGRTTAATGDPEDLTPAQVRTMLGLEAGGVGDIWVLRAGDTMTGNLFMAKDGSIGQVNITSYGNFDSRLALYNVRGTLAAPTATQAGDVLGQLLFGGWDTALSNGASIRAVAAAEWGTAADTTDNPTNIEFYTVPDTLGTLTLAMTILSTQQVKMEGDLILSGPTQDYWFTDRTSALALQSQTAATSMSLELFAKDGDATDAVALHVWGKGLPSSITNAERVTLEWTVAGYYSLKTVKSGTGTARDLHIFTEADTDALVLTTAGLMGVQQDVPLKLLHVGSGGGTPTQGYEGIFLDHAGIAQISARNVTNSTEGGFFSHTSNIYMGAWTNHGLILRTNNADRLTFTAAGAATFSGALTVTGQTKTDGDLLLSSGTQDYLVTDRSTALAIQAQTSATGSVIELYAKDGDATDSMNFSIFNVGTPASVTNSERTLIGWDAAGAYGYLRTLKSGTGTARPLQIYTEANVDQLVLTTGGKVGVGTDTVGGNLLGVEAGSSGNDAAVGGVLFVDSSAANNSGTGETTLSTYTLPLNTLAVNNQSVWFEAWGFVSGTANNKTIKVYFGATSVTHFVSTGANYGWFIRGRIVRTGAATQIYISTAISGSASAFVPLIRAAPTETLSGTVVMKVTGTGGASSDITLSGFIVGYDDSNT